MRPRGPGGFQKNFAAEVAVVIPEEARGKPAEIWFQDEARVGQQGTLTRVWARRGTRPRAPRDRRHKWAYIFGAVCPARRATASLVLPRANAEMLSLHLAEIGKQVAPGAHAILVLDGAGYHIVDKCCKAWNFFASDKAAVASITSRKWAAVND